MAWLAFGEPGKGGFYPLLARLVAFGFADPVDIFFFVAVTEVFESAEGFWVLLQDGHELIGHRQFFSFLRLGPGRKLYSGLVQVGGFFDIAGQECVFGQIRKSGDPAKLAHRRVTRFCAFIFIQYERVFPEPKRAMVLKGGHATEHSLVHKMGATPLERLLDLRTGGMNEGAKVAEDWFGKIRRVGDIGVDSRVSCWHTFLHQCCQTWKSTAFCESNPP